jgi:hypothetical protein
VREAEGLIESVNATAFFRTDPLNGAQPILNECFGLWVLKNSGQFWDFRAKTSTGCIQDRRSLYEVAGTSDIVGRLRNRTSRLMF